MFFTTAFRNRVIGLGLLLMLLITAFAQPKSFGVNIIGEIQRSSEAKTPISAILSLDNLPTLGAPATINCIVTSTLDAPETDIQIELPENVDVLQGATTWHGDLLADKSVTLSVQIVFNKAGNTAIFCRALRSVDTDNSWGDLAEYYLNIDQEASTPGFAPASRENRLAYGELVEAGDGKLIDPGAIIPILPTNLFNSAEPIPSIEPADEKSTPGLPGISAAGTLTVTGRWSYYNRNDVSTGGREMLVQLVRGDNGSHLTWCYTNLSGNYSCGPVTNPGAVGVRTIMWSYTSYSPYSDKLAVVNPDWGTTPVVENSYGMTQPSAIVLPDGTQNIGDWILNNGNNYERAFWVQRDIIDAWRYIYWGTGFSQSPVETSGPTTVEWKIDSIDGTYYSRGGNIHLKGADPLSNTVANHEYGHNIMYTVYSNWMPTTYCPSPHYINGASHVNCAWTEGWANFITIAVNNDPVYRWASGSSINLETPTWGTSGWDSGDNVEGRVAGALWDILDATNDGYDAYTANGIATIWDTLYHQNDDNFSQYWSAWRSRAHNQPFAVWSIYQNTIAYPYTSKSKTKNDFDGDGRTDVSIFRPSTGRWYVNGGSIWDLALGSPGDIPVPGDYNGDGTTDAAFFRPSTGRWYVNGSSIWGLAFGSPGDIPVPGDYNGDGTTDVAFFRPSAGRWYTYDGSIWGLAFGSPGDIPVPGDYNGDDKTDVAFFRPSTGKWYVNGGEIWDLALGAPGDIPLPGDYNGDGKTEAAFFRPSAGRWYVNGGLFWGLAFGAPGDIPVPGDYNGDGKTDVAIFRPSSGRWYVNGGSIWDLAFGAPGDYPLPAPDTNADGDPYQ